jgi:hypothetical protein
MSDRDELADIIETRIRLTGDPHETATAILAAGYHKPRTIATAEELDALPEDSVVLDDTRASHQRLPFEYRLTKEPLWAGFSDEPYTTDWIELPATVLWEPQS